MPSTDRSIKEAVGLIISWKEDPNRTPSSSYCVSEEIYNAEQRCCGIIPFQSVLLSRTTSMNSTSEMTRQWHLLSTQEKAK